MRALATGAGGRDSDHALLREALGWQPETALRDGIATTRRWLAGRLARRPRARQRSRSAP